MNILGLDVSTSITGATILDKDGKILCCEVFDTRNKNKFPTLYHKSAYIRDSLINLKEKYDISDIYIEESLQSFRSGFSSARTLSTLSKINGIVSYLVYDIFGTTPELISVARARKTCGIKVAKGAKAKEVVLEFLLDSEPDFVIDYTRHGNPRPGSYDKADSIIIARAGLEYCKQKNLKS